MIMGVDQGTTGTTTVAYDHRFEPVAEAYRELPNRFPRWPMRPRLHGEFNPFTLTVGFLDPRRMLRSDNAQPQEEQLRSGK